MKLNSSILLIVFILSVPIVKAQEIKFQTGAGITTVREMIGEEEVSWDVNPSFGFHAGPVIEFRLSNNISVKSGALLQLKGYVNEIYKEPTGQFSSTRYKFWYVDFPLLIKTGFLIGKQHFYSEFGPYAGIGLYIDGHVIMKDKLGNTTVNSHFIVPVGRKYAVGVENKGTLGLMFAVGTKIKSIELGLSFDLELSNNSHKIQYGDSHELKHRVISVYTTFPLIKL
jgi:hypothetical protein